MHKFQYIPYFLILLLVKNFDREKFLQIDCRKIFPIKLLHYSYNMYNMYVFIVIIIFRDPPIHNFIGICPLFLSDNDIFKLSTCNSNATIVAFIDIYVH